MIDLTQFEGHTPGPWTNDRFCQTLVVGKNNSHRAVASVGGFTDGTDRTHKENLSNTRLIIAAPDLLDEVKRLRRREAYQRRIIDELAASGLSHEGGEVMERYERWEAREEKKNDK